MEEIFKKDFNETEVLIENGDDIEEVVEEVKFSGYYDIYDVLIRTNEFDKSIIEEEIKVHAEKRYNRKYINARKHLIKDKRYIIRKAWAKSESEIYRKDLIQKNVVHIEKEVSIRFFQKEKIETIIPKAVEIEYISIFNGKTLRNNIKGKYIVTEKSDRFILESIPTEEQFAWEPKQIIFKDKILDIYMQERKNLSFKRIIKHAYDYTWAQFDLSGKTFFYRKPLLNGYIKNIFINKINYYHDYNGWFSAKAMKIRQTNKMLKNIEKEGLMEWYNYDYKEYRKSLYYSFDCEDYEDNEVYLSDIEYYVQPFLGMDKFYYEDNSNYDLLEKYKEESYEYEEDFLYDYDYYE